MATVKSGFNMDSIKGWMESNRITEVECLFPDFTGNARGKIIPANKFLREGGMRLPEVIFTQTVTGEYPDDDSMIDPLERDMQLYPDPNTIRFVPWALEPTAQVIHDCFDINGKLIDIAPRSVLRRVLSFYEKQGWKPVVAPELEFSIWSNATKTPTIRWCRRWVATAARRPPASHSVSMRSTSSTPSLKTCMTTARRRSSRSTP